MSMCMDLLCVIYLLYVCACFFYLFESFFTNFVLQRVSKDDLYTDLLVHGSGVKEASYGMVSPSTPGSPQVMSQWSGGKDIDISIDPWALSDEWDGQDNSGYGAPSPKGAYYGSSFYSCVFGIFCVYTSQRWVILCVTN